MSSIIIESSGNISRMTPWVPALAPVLSYYRTESVLEGYQRVCKRTKELLYSLDKENGAVFPSGMLSRVEAALVKRGYTVDIKELRDMAALMPEPDFSRLDPLREGQDQVILAVSSEKRGLIVCNTGYGKSFCIRQLCKLYPTLRILVVSPGRDDVKALYRNIAKDHPNGMVSLIGAGKNGNPNAHIVVATAASLKKCDLANTDLVLFDEAHICGYNQVSRTLGYVQKARMFGFTATPKGRCDKADVVIESLFGPVLVNSSYQESVEKGTAVPLTVVMLPSGYSGKPCNRADVFKKRAYYWTNTERNKAIATAARTFEGLQTLIMVETVEHAMQLKELLPDFMVVDSSLPAKVRDKATKDFESGEMKYAIATTIWKQAVDFKALQVLIRADGTSSPILSTQIPGRAARICENKHDAVIVDFTDEFDSWTEARAQRRLQTYRGHKWNITTSI